MRFTRKELQIRAFLGVAVAVLLSAGLAQAQYRITDARQIGYERGYREGYQYGLDNRSRSTGLDLNKDVDADRGYQSYFGSKDAYKEGYQQGYRDGATDGFAGTTTRFATIYAFPDPNFDPDTMRMNDTAIVVYRERGWGYQDVASDIGYRDGVHAGTKDRSHKEFDPHDHDAWKEADHGYDKSFGSKDAYKAAYRAAYEMGYRQAFGIQR
jgi:hypothetical protein